MHQPERSDPSKTRHASLLLQVLWTQHHLLIAYLRLPASEPQPISLHVITRLCLIPWPQHQPQLSQLQLPPRPFLLQWYPLLFAERPSRLFRPAWHVQLLQSLLHLPSLQSPWQQLGQSEQQHTWIQQPEKVTCVPTAVTFCLSDADATAIVAVPTPSLNASAFTAVSACLAFASLSASASASA